MADKLDITTGELIERPTLARLTEEGIAIRSLLLLEDTNQVILTEALTHVEGAWLTKVENIGMLVLDWEKGVIPAIEAEIDRLALIRSHLKSRMAWLKQYTLNAMLESGETELQFALVKVAVTKNPPSVQVLEETKVPTVYLRIKEVVEVDKAKILAQWKANGVVAEGCSIQTDNKRLVVK